MAKAAVVIVGLFVAMFIFSVFGGGSGDRPIRTTTPATTSASYQAAQSKYDAKAEEAERAAVARPWTYAERPDTMTGKPIKTASVSSVNQLAFEFPYSGAQRASLQLRVHPRFGRDAILSIQRGQFQCTADNCSILAKFDDGKPLKFSTNGPDDSSTDTLFIKPTDRFVAALKKAKNLTIEAQFYREGNRAIEFNVQALDW